MTAKNKKIKQPCDNWQELLISRHVLKDISRTNDAKLTRHLAQCKQCRQMEQQIQILNQASLALPQIKTSRSFERKLFSKLEIPKRTAATKAPLMTRIWNLIDPLAGRLKPAAAFFSIILIQFILLRIYFLPDTRLKGRPTPTTSQKRLDTAADSTMRANSPLQRRLSNLLASHKLRSTVSARIRTVRIPIPSVPDRPPPQLERKRAIDKPTSINEASNKTAEKPTKKRRKEKKAITDPRTDAADAIGSARGADTGRETQTKDLKKDKSAADRPPVDRSEGRKKTEESSRTAMNPEKRARMTSALPPPRSTLKRKSGPQVPRAADAPKKKTAPRERTETRITVTLKTLKNEETTLRAIAPRIRQKLRHRYGPKSRVNIRYTKAPEGRRTVPAAPPPAASTGPTPLLLLAIALELTVRILLLVTLKRDGRLTRGTAIATSLLGTLSLPWFLFRKG